MNIIDRDAREFGLHIRQGGWRLGLLVARNVQTGRGDYDHQKVATALFAEKAGTTKNRVQRHLRAWEKAAEGGFVPSAATLKPGTEIDIDAEKLQPWSDFYDATSGPGNTPSTKLVQQGIETATPEKLARVIGALPEETLSRVAETVETTRIGRKLYASQPKPAFDEAERQARSDDAQRRQQQPPTALVRLGTHIADVRTAVRILIGAWTDFQALTDDEDMVNAGRDRMIALRADIDLALGDALEGSLEDALDRLVRAERS